MKKEEPAAAPKPSAAGKDAARPEAGKDDARVKELEAERERLRAELGDARDKHLRARADYDNLLKRSAKEAQESVRFAKSSLLLRLAGFVETLEGAAKQSEGRPEAKGLKLLVDEAHSLLKDEGLKEIGGIGQPFNVRFHLAVERVESTTQPEGTIVEIVQRGYQWGEEILRPALVKVAAPPKAAPTAASGTRA